MKGVKGGKPAAVGKEKSQIMEEYNMAAFEKWDTEALVPCKNCGRTFLPASLKHHAKACKRGKPLKRRVTTIEENKENVFLTGE